MRWILDPKREDIELQLVLNHRDEAPWRSASRSLSKLIFFFLQNLSTAPPMKKIGSDKGASLFAHVSGVVLALCFLGNAFCQWGKSVTNSKEGKIARGC